MVWADWMVVALLECKRLEYDDAENVVGKDVIINSDVKWHRIQSLMRENGVNANITQLRNKWESTIDCYKKVRDWNHSFGNEPYFALDRKQRKAEKLSKDFPAEWVKLLDSFYGHQPSISPPCVAESLEDASITMNPHEQPFPKSEAKSDHNQEGVPQTSAIRHNSGVKRKTPSGKAATMLSNSIPTFTTSMLEFKKKCDEREKKRFVAIHELEKKKEERLERSSQMD
ncbi:hypothetical protein R1flu_007121 [Riccia fluitans]|uniref:Uncharacterized protein n=1 Tax=Riccia fluitans TaxID=41844 RepID=A0ABD1YXX8_9MARC